MATKKRKSTKRRTAARRKKAEQRLPAGLGTLFGGLLLIVLAFVRGDSVWRVLHDVLFGLFHPMPARSFPHGGSEQG